MSLDENVRILMNIMCRKQISFILLVHHAMAETPPPAPSSAVTTTSTIIVCINMESFPLPTHVLAALAVHKQSYGCVMLNKSGLSLK